MPKISVIVPMYGVEEYIERCARSLFEQTMEDMEFIFVDDCSKDKSVEVLEKVIEEYPNRKNSVKIIHHDVNKGLPQARKTGVYASTGEYIAHCDSDDWMDLNAYQLLYEKAKETDADMVFFDYTRTDGKSREDHIAMFDGLSREDIIVNMLAGKILFGVVFHIDKRSLYFDEGFVWPEYNMSEDLLFTCQLVSRAKTISKLYNVLYFYYYNPLSLTKTRDDSKRLAQSGGNIAKLITVLEGSNLANKELCVLLCKLSMKHRCVDGIMTREGYRRWRNTYPEVKMNVIFDKRIPKVMRIRYFLGYTRTFQLVKMFTR